MWWCFPILCITFQYVCSQALDNIGTQYAYHVLHSLDTGPEPQFLLRGYISLHSSKSGAGVYVQDLPLSNEDIDKLKKASKNGGIYRVKLVSNTENSDFVPVFSYTKACSIYQSGLTDLLSITVDQGGVPIGIAVSALPALCTGETVPDSKLRMFNTSVFINGMVNAPSPDTLTYIQRVEQEKAEKARGDQGDNRSFLSKYWMYIIPLVVFLFISGASGPEGQASGR